MQVIISHAGADFDSLASMVAAGRLYPQALLFFVGAPEPNVREFLTLHRGFFDVKYESEYHNEGIERVVVVDTREPARLGVFAHAVSIPGIEVHIYDHHPPTRESIIGDIEVIEKQGACITILLKSLRSCQVEISATEATLYLLALYEETGSLTFSSTTPEDVQMVSWLLSLGANLSSVPNFAQHSLNEQQRGLLGRLLAYSKVTTISGFRILTATAECEHYVDELASIAHRVMELERPDVLFCIVRMGANRIFIVARSIANSADVGSIMREFGGGGHPTAASACVHDTSINSVADDLIWILEARLPRSLTAKDIMSSPVICLDLDSPQFQAQASTDELEESTNQGPSIDMDSETIEEAKKLPRPKHNKVTVGQASVFLRKLGHSAVCVRLGGQLCGIIARSDLDKAIMHGLSHAPATVYMNRKVVSVSPDSPLRDIQRILVENDIGRVPVIDGKALVGIVSRTDILRELNDTATVPVASPDTAPIELLNLHPEQLARLKQCGEIGEEIGFQVYAVGGFVRDMLMNIPNNDLDLVVEGDGIAFAHHLAQRLHGRCSEHEAFATAVVVLPDGDKIDVVTARTETYTRPAALPVVQGSTLKQDLYRRDFSINAMALQLSANSFGHLVDFFGARRDVRDGVIRILHNLSFVDDPTRVFRAIKFEQRYSFSMDTNTEHLLKAAVQSHIMSFLSFERVRDELVQILNEPRPIPAIIRMDRLKVLKVIDPKLSLSGRPMQILENVADILNDYSGLVRNGTIKVWILYLNVLLGTLSPQEANALLDRYRFRADDRSHLLLLNHTELSKLLHTIGRFRAKDSEIAGALRHLPLEACLYLGAFSRNSLIRERVAYYLRSLRFVDNLLDGKALVALGYPKGPLYSQILKWVWEQHVDGLLTSVEQAQKAVLERWPHEQYAHEPIHRQR